MPQKLLRPVPCLLRFHVPLNPSRATETVFEREQEMATEQPKLPANLLINKQSAQLDDFIPKDTERK